MDSAPRSKASVSYLSLAQSNCFTNAGDPRGNYGTCFKVASGHPAPGVPANRSLSGDDVVI
jgi:hypothetical protein